MIKNKVNPVAAEGASSYEGAGERRRGGEGGEKGRMAIGETTLRGQDSVCSSLW